MNRRYDIKLTFWGLGALCMNTFERISFKKESVTNVSLTKPTKHVKSASQFVYGVDYMV